MDIWRDQSLKARRARWEALWAMEDLPRPVWFIPASPVLALSGEWILKKRSVTGLFLDRDVQLSASLKFNRFFERIQPLWSRDDFIPHLQPQQGVAVFASAFGCEVKFPWDNMPWSKPVIKAGEPAEKVYDLSPPDVRAGLLGDLLDFAEYFDRKAGYRYPIALTDLQGPLDTAYLVWDSCDFMVAMYEHPKEVHRLLRLTTDLIIKFVKEMRSKVRHFLPAHFPPVYLEDGQGITVSEDCLAVLSAPLWAEFSLPYLNELSEEFGGLIIHSCGNLAHQLENLGRVHKLRGLNFGVSETDFGKVWEKFGGRTVIIPHCSLEIIVARFKNAVEWVEHVLRKKTMNRGLALMAAPMVGDVHQAAKNIALGRQALTPGKELFFFGRDIRRLIKRYA